ILREYKGTLLSIDGDWQTVSNEASFPPDTAAGPANLAYVIYTSGSTGKPKGVLVEHRNVVSFTANLPGSFGFKKDMRIAALTTYGFDISVLELLCPLAQGMTVILLNELDPEAIQTNFKHLKIDILQLTPSRLNQWIAADDAFSYLRDLQIILIGGEPMPMKLFTQLKEMLPGIPIFNVYGPTETTIWSSHLNINSGDELNIGYPLIGEQLYILNQRQGLSAKGVAGEICIGGPGVSRGYLNKPELTSERFIPNPFGDGLLYRTGDIGRWLANGKIEHLGRSDDQVKIRGYRIELSEIEYELEKLTYVKQSSVTAKTTVNGEKQLIGYVITSEPFERNKLTSYLQQSLPLYMIPQIWIELDAFPLNSSGKIDKKKLPDPDHQEISGNIYVKAETATEAELVTVWEKVLGRIPIGIDDDFFNLGGNSLTVMRLISAMKKQIGMTLSVPLIFQFRTIRSLAGYMDYIVQKEIMDLEKDADVFEI
ncbi:non-ribosomal peptide synthetase, partial [Mucilaginibacter sp. SG538B]|uniref:non-ribosomal peptide synthetase n=1 Tax=Mucilaginibacter sp. SG538B TaxID=2587021 RepID=UPI00159D778B